MATCGGKLLEHFFLRWLHLIGKMTPSSEEYNQFSDLSTMIKYLSFFYGYAYIKNKSIVENKRAMKWKREYGNGVK